MHALLAVSSEAASFAHFIMHGRVDSLPISSGTADFRICA